MQNINNPMEQQNYQNYNNNQKISKKKILKRVIIICMVINITFIGLGLIFTLEDDSSSKYIVKAESSPTGCEFNIDVDEFIEKYNELATKENQNRTLLNRKFWNSESVTTDLGGNKYQLTKEESFVAYAYETFLGSFSFYLKVDSKTDRVIEVGVIVNEENNNYMQQKYIYDVCVCATNIDYNTYKEAWSKNSNPYYSDNIIYAADTVEGIDVVHMTASSKKYYNNVVKVK